MPNPWGVQVRSVERMYLHRKHTYYIIQERLYTVEECPCSLSVETEANGDSKSTYERGHSLVGFSGLS
jgi:hypothetical protein